MAKATFHVQLRPEFTRYGRTLRRVVLERATQEKPRKPVGGTLMVKVTLNIPDEAFMPLEPEAEVDVPVEATRIVVANVDDPKWVSAMEEVRRVIAVEAGEYIDDIGEAIARRYQDG